MRSVSWLHAGGQRRGEGTVRGRKRSEKSAPEAKRELHHLKDCELVRADVRTEIRSVL